MKQRRNIVIKMVLLLLMTSIMYCSTTTRIKRPEAPRPPIITFRAYEGIIYLNEQDAVLLKNFFIDYLFYLEELKIYDEVRE